MNLPNTSTLWLVTTTASNLGRLSVGSQARTSRLADPAQRWAGAALYDGGTLACLAARERGEDVDELGVIVHGPDSHRSSPLHALDKIVGAAGFGTTMPPRLLDNLMQCVRKSETALARGLGHRSVRTRP